MVDSLYDPLVHMLRNSLDHGVEPVEQRLAELDADKARFLRHVSHELKTPLAAMREALLLATQPLMGRARPELGAGLRSWPTETPYILFYETDADGITIIRALHHARDVQTTDFSLH